jgi:imidazoleglycerol phosphate synthase glutamine amidotransferase subunit HisH
MEAKVAIKTMDMADAEQAVKNIELVEQITADPRCNTHHARLIKDGVGLFCPICKDLKRIHSMRDSSTILL